jgi:hypothetical protein
MPTSTLKTPPRLIPTLPQNVQVVSTPVNLRELGSVLGFAEHMFRDYSKNTLAVRVQREDNVYRYLKGEVCWYFLTSPLWRWVSVSV